MSCLVEQPPYCDLLRLSPATRRFVRFRRACLRAWGWLIQFACVLEGKRGGFFFNLVSKYLWIVLFGPLLSQLCTRVRFPPRAINYWIMLVQSGQIARWPHTVVTERTEHFCLVNEALVGGLYFTWSIYPFSEHIKVSPSHFKFSFQSKLFIWLAF